MHWIINDLIIAFLEVIEMIKSRRFWELLIKGD
jgi:hypothetical protein